MISKVLQKATKKWLKRYGRKELVPSVRAVFIGDFVSTEVIVNECYDTPTLDFYCNELFPRISNRSTALDIGANIGNHTTVIAKHFDRVIAFEPNPQTALLLRANTMGGGRSIQVVEMGCSDEHGCRNFEIEFDNVGGSRVVDTESDYTVEVETIDRLSKKLELSNVSFVKIDVEGHEAKVLAGARHLLESQHPIIALELHAELVPDVAEQVNRMLQEAGYGHFYVLEPDRLEWRWIPRRCVPKMLWPKTRRMVTRSVETIADKHGHVIVSAKRLSF